MELTVTGDVFEWRGPAPYHFVAVGEEGSDLLDALSPQVSYGWGMIPVAGTIGRTSFTTALWPRNGRYVVPLKDKVRAAEGIEMGDEITIALRVLRPEERRRPGRHAER